MNLFLTLLIAAVATQSAVDSSSKQADTTLGEGTLFQTTVSGTRRKETVFESVRLLSVVDRHEREERMSRNAPEALAEETGVFLQQTNSGGGMPILRGMHGNRVLILVDGIRVNNSTTRAGPNQSFSTIDATMMDRIEVLRGTGSASLGSDALGGAINFLSTQASVRGTGEVHTSVVARGAGAESSAGFEGRANWSTDRFGAVATASARHMGNPVAGGAIGAQPFNSYNEWSASGNVAVEISDRQLVRAAVQTTQQYDVLRAYGSSPLDFRKFTRQNRLLSYARYEVQPNDLFRSARVTLSYQRQGERFERFRVAKNVREREDLVVHTMGVQAETQFDFSRLGNIVAGVDMYLDRIESAASTGALADEQLILIRSMARYVPKSQYDSANAFVSYDVDLVPTLRLFAEGRGGYVRIGVPSDARLFDRLGGGEAAILPAVQSIVGVYGWGAHLRYQPISAASFSAGATGGFRAPNIDDYSRIGGEGGAFVIPTSNLRPERSVAAELSAKFASGDAELAIGYSYTTIFDAMARERVSINGFDLLDELPVARVINSELATFHSVEVSGRWPIVDRLMAFGSIAYTQGEVKRPTIDRSETLVEPATKVPPAFGRFGVGYYSRPRRWHVEALGRFAFDQRRLSEADRSDTRICPELPGTCQGTRGFLIGTIRGGYKLTEWMIVNVAVENVTNAVYRMHASAINGPGINLVGTLEVQL